MQLHAEVNFPNLHFSTTTVDFGCVLNSTETCKQIWITNCSPLPLTYWWTFLDDQKHNTIRYIYCTSRNVHTSSYNSTFILILTAQCCYTTNVSKWFTVAYLKYLQRPADMKRPESPQQEKALVLAVQCSLLSTWTPWYL